ncbi:DEAD/DEAH box helicase [Candidatus Parcubacteria bacterium]|nr:MAG: DEAD/DEAH box helicase [Candidatus Parcubacteria bacterium]
MNRSSGFYDLGIAPNILGVLDKLGFNVPTPIQERSIPPAIEGKDLMGIAQTGTGKTLAFGVPMVQAALGGKQGLVVLPTRELAIQVNETFEKIGGPLRIRTAMLVGGEPIRRQIYALQRNPQIVIGTPGRIIDHLEQKTLSLGAVRILVLDEADRMLDMGFAPQLRRILQVLSRERQTMLFSATMPQDIVAIAQSHMKLPVRVEIAPSGTMAAKVTHELFFVQRPDKPRLLEKILAEYRGSILVFSRTKFGARKIAAGVRSLGHASAEIHSNRSLSQRREALDGFRNGKYRILVATDIAARGIDVKGIELVLNYDLPQSPEDYVHRIGRTGRAGGVGHAISFATPDQKNEVRGIERLIRATLPLSKLPELPPARAAAPSQKFPYPHHPRPQRSGSTREPRFGRRPSFRNQRRFR